MEHLLAEDIVQTFELDNSHRPTPLLGAVGPLQFEVLQYRLRDEYKAETNLEMMSWRILRWVETSLDNDELKRVLPSGAALGRDDQERRVMLFDADWSLKYFSERNPSIVFLDSPHAEHKVPIYARK